MTQVLERLPVVGDLVKNGDEARELMGRNKMPEEDDFRVGAVLCALRESGDQALVIATKTAPGTWWAAGLGLESGPLAYNVIREGFGKREVWFASQWTAVVD